MTLDTADALILECGALEIDRVVWNDTWSWAAGLAMHEPHAQHLAVKPLRFRLVREVQHRLQDAACLPCFHHVHVEV